MVQVDQYVASTSSIPSVGAAFATVGVPNCVAVPTKAVVPATAPDHFKKDRRPKLDKDM